MAAETPTAEIVDATTAEEAVSSLFNDVNLFEAAVQEEILNPATNAAEREKAIAFASLRNLVRFALEGAESCNLNAMLSSFFDVAEQAGRIRQRALEAAYTPPVSALEGQLATGPQGTDSLNAFQFRFQSAIQSVLKSGCHGNPEAIRLTATASGEESVAELFLQLRSQLGLPDTATGQQIADAAEAKTKAKAGKGK